MTPEETINILRRALNEVANILHEASHFTPETNEGYELHTILLDAYLEANKALRETYPISQE